MGKLSGKVAVVTGGGSGVGKAVAKAFVEAGANVVIAGRDKAKLDAVAMQWGGQVLAVACDVAKAEQCKALIDAAVAKFGKVDILVNNAGTNLKERTMRELTPETWDKMIRANLDGTFYCIHYALPGMLERKDGVIVNVVSISGKRGNPLGGAAYVASKFGQGGLGMCLSNEERESGIRVSNVYPGEIDTPILEHRPKPVSAEARAIILKPEDVAETVLFVASLPKHVSIPELIIKPSAHQYM
jgi:NADP-dependent 3-hydroxy acid dehydrogenase YdfG